MRRLIAWAARLYPPAWRKRYGEEFTAMVEEMPAPGWGAVWDVWKGAAAMQFQYGPNWKWLPIFGALGFALAWGISLRIPDLYLSESVVKAANVDPESFRRSLQRVISRPELQSLIEKHHLYADEHSRLPLEDIVEKTKKSVHISTLDGQDPGNRTFTVAFTHENPAVAQRVAGDLVDALVQQEGLLSVLDPASRPDPIYPNRPVFAFCGLLGGTLLGSIWALLKRAAPRPQK